MIQKFLKDSTIYTIGTILTRGVQIVMLPVLTRLLSKADYGVIDILTLLQGLVNVVILLEIIQGFARFYSDVEDDNERIKYSSTFFWFVLVSYTVFLITSLIFADYLVPVILTRGFPVGIFRIALFSIWGAGIFFAVQNLLRWYLLPKQYALVGITSTVISYTLTIILLYYFKIGIASFFWGLIAGYFVASIQTLFYIKKQLKFVFISEKLKTMLSYSLPLVPAALGMFVLLYIDRIAIKNILTLADVGVFGIAARFTGITGIVFIGFQTALGPLIFQNYKKAETQNEFARILKYFLVVILVFISILSIFSIEALKIFTTPAFYSAAGIIPVLCFANLFFTMSIFAPGLQIAKKTKIIGVINILGGIINFILNFLLIPKLGIFGAALSTFTTAALIFNVNMYFSQKYFPVPHNWRKIVTSFLISFIFFFLVLKIQKMIEINFILAGVIKLFLMAVFSYVMIQVLIGWDLFIKIKSQIVDIIKIKYLKV